MGTSVVGASTDSVLVLENLVIHGTNVWNRFYWGFLADSLGTSIFASALANVFECSGLNLFSFALRHLLNRQCWNWIR